MTEVYYRRGRIRDKYPEALVRKKRLELHIDETRKILKEILNANKGSFLVCSLTARDLSSFRSKHQILTTRVRKFLEVLSFHEAIPRYYVFPRRIGISPRRSSANRHCDRSAKRRELN